jgi:2-oxoglutarate ferredoxin oxidoreductase subunit delta
MEACPKEGIRISKELNIKGYHPAEFVENENDEKRKCTGCTLCAVMCPEVCIEVFRD